MFDHIRPLLKECGFSHRECETYLALLSLGSGSVQEISDKSGIHRTATYPALESLIEKGLAVEEEASGRAVFFARSPERLRETMAGDLEVMRHRMERLNESMKEMMAAFYSGQGKPRVQYFEGMHDIMRLRDEISMSQDAIWEWFTLDEHLDAILQAASDTRDRHMRLQHGRTLLIVPQGRAIPDFDANRFEVRVNHVDRPPFSGGLAITGQKSYLFSYGKEPSVLVIDSPALVAMMRTLFEGMWLQGKAVTR